MTKSLRATLRSAILLATALAAAQTASAASVDDTSEQAPRIEINLAGIDLTTPEGQSAAHRRISVAAQNVCRETIDLDGTNMRHFGCILAARRDGGRQLDGFVQQAMAARAGGVRSARLPGKDHAAVADRVLR